MGEGEGQDKYAGSHCFFEKRRSPTNGVCDWCGLKLIDCKSIYFFARECGKRTKLLKRKMTESEKNFDSALEKALQCLSHFGMSRELGTKQTKAIRTLPGMTNR